MSSKKLFISYSHADTALLAVLRTHLKPLERAGVIAPWFDGYMIPGDDIDTMVRSALERAELIALLVSADFLASDYCYDIEMQAAVRRHEERAARVVPIIARECQWRGAPFGRLVAVPTDGRPIMSAHWPDKDHAWTLVAKGIEAAAQDTALRAPQARASASTPTPRGPVTPAPLPLKVKKRFTDKDKDGFKTSAFDHVARRFEASMAALESDLSGSFRRIDANRFTATIYRGGAKEAGCTVWLGGSLSSDSICYSGDDRGETNSMSEWLLVEAKDDALVLKPQMSFARGREESDFDPEEAAQFLWQKLVERIELIG